MKSRRLPRGMKDIWPEEMGLRLWISERILDVFRRYGFRLVEPSPIESLEVLEAKSGPSIREEIYWFKDKAGRSLGLRFDLTVGLARMVAGRPDLAMPVKLAALSNMWRYDEPQYGRYRCFYQWDAEIFGSPEPEADAEIIALSMDVLEALGIREFEVRVSSRRLAEGFLRGLGIGGAEAVEATLRVIDKYRKLSARELEAEFEGLGLNRKQIKSIFDFIKIQAPTEEALAELRKLGIEGEGFARGLKEVEQALKALEAMGKDGRVLVDMSIVRGLGYYDGLVFEVYDRLDPGLGALVGGGRYDGLCKLYGRDLPATGAAGGIERTILALEKRGVKVGVEQKPRVFVASIGEACREALRVVATLRAEGIPVDYDLKGRGLRGQLEYADSLGVPYVLVIGPREAASGRLRLRDMEKREEKEVTLEEVLRLLRG